MSEEDETVAGLARRWLRWAQEDLGLARSAHADPDVVPRGACTWAHQCGEKALKAILVAQELDPPQDSQPARIGTAHASGGPRGAARGRP